jgi:hypothetical protein
MDQQCTHGTAKGVEAGDAADPSRGRRAAYSTEQHHFLGTDVGKNPLEVNQEDQRVQVDRRREVGSRPLDVALGDCETRGMLR